MKRDLFTPGPTNIPEEVMLEMAKPIIHHRTEEFENIFGNVREDIKELFGTKRDVIVLSGSGTLGMEAAVINTLSEGDKVLIVNAGKFGERWIEIAKTYNLDVISIDIEWGHSVNPDIVIDTVKKNPSIKAVLVQAGETSTTTCHPIKEIGTALKAIDGPLFIVDGIIYIGVSQAKMDEWGVDLFVSGSQKALMLPPGLSFVAISERAEKQLGKSSLPKYYANLVKELKAQRNYTTAYTPAISLILGLKKSLDLIKKEGLENVHLRHRIMAEMTRKAISTLNLELLSKGIPSDGVTGIILEEKIAKDIINFAKYDLGITFAGGQGKLSGRVIRISHMGYCYYLDVIKAISALELSLVKNNVDIKLGEGVRAAENVLKDHLIGK